ncbi:MAG TPA: oligosaccharide flippase family protein [Candidatus Levybacteria bacterium]|nr:oligosaccharide flippase family protein [Candidatus Levybacteria bacterium]
MVERSELVRILLNTASQIAVRFSGTITTFLTTLLILSFLGVSSLGSFVKITSFVALFYILIDFGLNTTYLRDHFDKTEDFFGNLIFLRLLLSLCVFLLVCCVLVFVPAGFSFGFSQLEKLGVFVYSFTLFTEGVLISFSGLTQKKLIQKTLILPSIISSIVVIFLVILGVISSNFFLILLSYPIGELVQILLLLYLVKRSILFRILPISFYSFSKKTLIAAVPLAFMLFLNVIYFRIDTIVLSMYKTNVDVGIYGFSYKIFEFLLVIPTFLSASVFPILIQHKNNSYEFRKRVKSYSVILLGISVFMSILVFLLAPLLVYIKSDIAASQTPLQILSVSLPFFFLTSLMQWVLLLKGKIRSLIIIYFLTMCMNIVLNVVLVPVFSYNASAAVTVGTEILVFFCMIPAFIFATMENSTKRKIK